MTNVELSFTQVFILITIVWVLVRGLIAVKNRCIDWKRECLLLTVYLCIVVITRIVYFPWHLEKGHIAPLRFDSSKIIPLWVNLKPFTFVHERYDGWKLNVIGNIAMFIPAGICWPLCFRQLDRIWKVVLAGFGFSLLIELSQLFFYERGSDVDDLILNTAGVLIGALIYFLIKAVRQRRTN